MTETALPALLHEYDIAQTYSLDLIAGLEPQQIAWRPHENSSAIAWHLGHQAAVNHYMVRNLTAAEVTLNAHFDTIFDSATPEPERGDLPPLADIVDYRHAIAFSTHRTVTRIHKGDVGAPNQLPLIAHGMVAAIINHEYQHAKWIEEVRSTMTDDPPPQPGTTNLANVDDYHMIRTG